MRGRTTDITGKTFGNLIAVRLHHVSGKAFWDCLCTCGRNVVVRADGLTRGKAGSCGCKRHDAAVLANRSINGGSKHGHAKGQKSLTYRSWRSMRDRCTNPRNKFFHRYGGRGIAVCARWDSFEHFLADMGERTSSLLTIERIDNSGPYTPENCRWATRQEQALNKGD